MAPTRRAAAAMGILALAGLIISDFLAITLAIALVAVFLVDAWQVRTVHAAEREVGDVLSRGVPTQFSVHVPQRSNRTIVRQPGTPDLRVDARPTDDGIVGTVTAIRRGDHALPPLAVRVIGPLGLASWSRTIGDAHAVQVYPDMVAARRLASQVRHNMFQFEGLRIRGSLGLGTAFDSIREYVDGDDVRRVNWLATARQPAPMVNQYRIESDRDVLCVIDCGRLMGAPIGQMSRLDAAVDAAAAVAAVADVVGDRVGVVAFDREVLRDIKPVRRGGEAVARAIFDLEPSSVESSYHLVFERIAAQKRAFVLVLTDLLDEAAARPIGQAIPALGRKHEVAVASVSDPDVAAALLAEPKNVEDAARAVVAGGVAMGRDAALAEVRRHGARVIDANPSSFGPACVAAYLEAKARVRV